jgi:sec-independent protein translocase protein TatC
MAATKPLDQDRPFIAHLLELRNRLLRSVAVVVAMFFAIFPFADQLYTWLSGPLRAVLPVGASMIAIKPIAPFMIPLKLAFLTALALSVPYLLYQVWAFVAPGLYRHERRLVWPLMLSSSLLFYLGAAFAYLVVFPIVFRFITGATPSGVLPMTDIGEYLDFVTTMFFAFGAAFEVPVAIVLLTYTGAATPDDLRRARPYVIVGAFVLGAIFTPPDVISQFLLAGPMWLLYELGILFSVWFVRPRQGEDEPAEDE